MKESFIFYRSFYEAIKDLKKKDKLQVYEAISEFSLNQNELELTGTASTVFKLIRPQLKANDKRYKNSCKGGNPNFKKGKPNPYYQKDKLCNDKPNKNDNSDNLEITKRLPNENENENERERVINITLPALTDIISYGLSLGANSEYCEKFYNHYESIGWVNGNGLLIKNWKLVFKNWYKKDLAEGKINDRSKYDTRKIYEEKDTGRCFQYDEEGNKHYVGD